MTLSFLAGEIKDNYQSIDKLKHTEDDNKKLRQLIVTYEKQIAAAENDPEMLKRLQKKILRTGELQEDAALPQAPEDLIKLARKALSENDRIAAAPSKLRKYIERSAEKRNRMGLFYSGAALILIAFIFFGTPKKQKIKRVAQVDTDLIRSA